MDKLRNKRNILIISSLIVALIVIIAILIGNTGDKDIKESKEDMASAIEETKVSADATEEEKEAVEELQAEYQEKISEAKDSKEVEKLKTEFEKKAQEATGNKVSVPSKPSKPAGQSKPSGSSGSESSTKPNTSSEVKPVVKPEGKPEGKPSSGGSGNAGNTVTTNKPSGGNQSGGGLGSSSGGSTKPSHTHIAQGNMGWANSPDGMRSIYNNAYSTWKAKVERGDTTSPEPINFSYKKCSCGKYTGTFVYGKPHSHIAVGNTGKWFNSAVEAEAYYDNIVAKFDNDVMNGTISPEYYDSHAPFGWSAPQCMCGKYTLNIKYPD